MKLSIIVPTYNEKENIERFIPKLENTLSKKNFEVLIMDDSSTDGTIEAAKKLCKKYKNLNIIVRKKREGIGAAIKHGLNVAKGDLLISTDVDSFEPKDIFRLIDKINQGYDLVTGSRYIKGGSYKTRYFRTFINNIISRVGNKFAKIILNIPTDDFTMNFRAIKKDVWDKLDIKENTNSFFLHTIVQTYFKGYKVAQIPIAVKDREFGVSKIRLVREYIKIFLNVLKYTINYRLKGNANENSYNRN